MSRDSEGPPVQATETENPTAPPEREPSRALPWLASLVLLAVVVGGGFALWKWKLASFAAAAAQVQPEQVEIVTAARARAIPYVRRSTSIGTVLALRSVTLRNEEPGTVSEVGLETGRIVEEGELLVQLDVSVEQAQLAALEAQATLTESLLDRIQRASANDGASEADVDRARAERDVALAEVARLRAQIERKTLRAPFRARVGLSDVHPGQYLSQGASLTTLQGIDDAVHVDFSTSQEVAAGLALGQQVEVQLPTGEPTQNAEVVAIDALVDPLTRNAMVRARLEVGEHAPRPGSSVRVSVPIGAEREVVAVPISALRKSAMGDHVFVLTEAEDGATRAAEQRVRAGAVLGEEVVIEEGLEPGVRIAALGSFKLREGVQVMVTGEIGPPEPQSPPAEEPASKSVE